MSSQFDRILDEMGLDADEVEWHDLALCNGVPIKTHKDDIFFDKYESDVEAAKATDQMCLHCPVMKPCFFQGLSGESGVYGGVYWNGAGKPDKNKNAHKTDEVWQEIYRRVK